MKKPKIKYPCKWEYKIIGEKDRLSEKNILDAVKDRKCNIVFSRKSKQGNYVSFQLETEVVDEADRNEVFAKFFSCTGVKMVL